MFWQLLLIGQVVAQPCDGNFQGDNCDEYVHPPCKTDADCGGIDQGTCGSTPLGKTQCFCKGSWIGDNCDIFNCTLLDENRTTEMMHQWVADNAVLGYTENDYLQSPEYKIALQGGCVNGICTPSGCQCDDLRKYVDNMFEPGTTYLGFETTEKDRYEANEWVKGFSDVYEGQSCAILIPKWYHIRTYENAANNALPIIFYIFWISYAIFLALWVAFKVFVSLSKAHMVLEKDSVAVVAKSHAVAMADLKAEQHIIEETPLLGTNWVPAKGNLVTPGHVRIEGFKNHWLGTLAHTFFWVFTTSLFAAWGVIYFDTYWGCRCDSIDQACFSSKPYSPIFGGYATNSTVMVTLWFICLIWFSIILAVYPKLRNFHRLPAPLTEATSILAIAPQEAEVLSRKVGFAVRCLRSLKDSLGYNSQGNVDTVEVQQTDQAHKFFVFECARYVMSHDGKWSHPHVETNLPCSELLQLGEGLTSEVHDSYIDYVGQNCIPFKVDSYLTLTRKEVFRPFYLYQFQCYSALGWFSYLLVTICFDAVIILAAAINIYLARKNLLTIQQMTQEKSTVEVRRDGKWVYTDAKDLVPRDVVKVRGNKWAVPCDLVILSSRAIVDESGLTGESMPVTKTMLNDVEEKYSPTTHKRSTLFSGTQVLQAGTDDSEVTAMVISTGLDTNKGSLVATILYPRPMIFKYDEELQIVVILLFLYGAICFPVCWAFQGLHGNSSGITRFIYGIDMWGRIMSPLLPVALVLGEQMSARRLNKVDVFCINPKRIAISGKIRIMCFDKTGTLTKDGLDFLGVHEPADQEMKTTAEMSDSSNITWNAEISPKSTRQIVTDGLATCHAVSKLETNDGTQYVGNQVEVQMFTSTGCDLQEEGGIAKVSGPGVNHTIVRRFEFDHAKMCMTVVTKNEKTGELIAYTKGSFEKIGTLSNPESLPTSYLSKSEEHAMEGCYVLGLGYQKLGDMSSEDLANLQRDDLEVNGQLHFLSLILFRNELKPDSKQAIEHLKSAHIRTVMITGDNAQCGMYIAKESGMLQNIEEPDKPHRTVYLGDYDKEQKQVLWRELGGLGIKESMSTSEIMNEKDACELAVTGAAFNELRGANGKSDRINALLLNIRIFARMSPDDKVACVEHHVQTDDLVVGMCGDGGNDCGALRTAHSGMALSEAEASVVSPFTSKTKSIQSVVDLIREGRAALTNSFAGYKYLIIYGQLFSYAKLASFYLGVIMSMMQYFYIDVIAIIVLGYAIIQSQPLSKILPSRPTASLLGPITMASVLGVCFINFIFIFIALVGMERNPGYVPWPAGLAAGADWWTLGKNWECTYIFTLTASLFLSSSIVYSFGWNYRKSWFYNWQLVIACLFLILFIWFVLLLEPGDTGGIAAVFHFASIQWNNPETPNTSLVWIKYNDPSIPYDTDLDRGPSPAMSPTERATLVGLIAGAIVVSVIWEKVFIQRCYKSQVQKFPPFKI